ncbi:uncharacterized protein LOC132760281 [Ruditapes philippinarum]|uniref:uncharacterized protein LOC132760281 n=1 Tax=Ruditapes philippinarum TaxID=129788 RepID=UPI00295A71A0|nr:uncharacterized protein LOC132760281 [Ruditapes philippinarum]
MGVNRSGIIYFIVIACLCQLIVVLEATVSLTAYGDIASDGRLKCNGQCVLVCEIIPTSLAVVWKINKHIFFECIHNSCITYGTNYTFSFDITQGIFNLSMDKIIYADNLKQFKCDDDSEFASFTARIKVIPEGSATTIASSSDSSSTTIKVTTGCLSPSTSVSFTWYYFKEGQTPILFEKNLPLESTDEDGCTNGQKRNQRRATSEEISPGLRRKEIDIESAYEQLDKSKNEIRLYTSIENIRTAFSNKDYVK